MKIFQNIGMWLCKNIAKEKLFAVESQVSNLQAKNDFLSAKVENLTAQVKKLETALAAINVPTDKNKDSDILLIDESDGFLTMIQSFLETKGHSVDIAHNGSEARMLYTKKPYKVIATGIFLTDGNGYEIVLDLRKMGLIDRAIVWSGGGRTPASDYLTAAAALGVKYTFPLPIDLQKFHTAVEKIIAEQN